MTYQLCGVVAESYQGEGKDKDMDWYRNLTLMAVAALENDVKTVTKLISAGCDPADNQTAFFAGQAGSLRHPDIFTFQDGTCFGNHFTTKDTQRCT